LKLIEIKNTQGKIHIAKGVIKGRQPKSALCGYMFKRTWVKRFFEGNAENCTCRKCLKSLSVNSDALTI
jgi:hypothetical protein